MSASITKYTPILLALALFLPACQMNVGTVEVKLVYSTDQYPLDLKDVSTLRLRIEGDDLGAQKTEFSRIGGGGGALTDIPLGKNRVLTVEGLDDFGKIQSRGVSMPFRTKSGTTKVFLLPRRCSWRMIGMISTEPTWPPRGCFIHPLCFPMGRCWSWEGRWHPIQLTSWAG